MEMQLLYVFNLFALVGVVGILIYLVVEYGKNQAKDRHYDRQLDKLDRLERHVYELEERLAEASPSVGRNDLKEKIIAMYEAGDDLMYIEDALDVSRAKIEMVLKFHQLRQKREKN